MPVITDIYRPIADTSFMEGVRAFADTRFSESVELAEPENDGQLRVRLVRPGVLEHLRTPPDSAQSDEVMAKLTRSLPATFWRSTTVANGGVSDFPNPADSNRNLLVVKLRTDDVLNSDTKGIFYGLYHYGARPAGRFFYNFLIGTVDITRVRGEEKLQLRQGINRLMPRMIELERGVIDTK